MQDIEPEVVIIGAGAAGLSAGLTLARARRRVLIIDSGLPRNRFAEHSHGYLTRDGMSPQQLLESGRGEVESYGGQIVSGTVQSIDVSERTPSIGSLTLTTGSHVVRPRAVLVATGITDILPSIPGVAEGWGRTVHHCSYCHGAQLDPAQEVVVLGGDNKRFVLKQTKLLRHWVSTVSLVTCGMDLTETEWSDLRQRGIDVLEQSVHHVADNEEGGCTVTLDNGDSKGSGAVFVGPIFKPNDLLLRGAGCAVDGDDWIQVDQHGRTSVPGIWAAGNVISSPDQIVNAAAAGATAAININDTLLGLA